MSLKNVSARCSSDGLKLELIKDSKVLESLPIVKAKDQHRSFILSTWIRSYLPTAKKWVHKDVYHKEEQKVAERDWIRCHVVTNPEDEFTVVAWICGAPSGILRHVWVMQDLRNLGIAKALIERFCGKNVVATKPWPFQHTPRGLHWTFNPYRMGI